MFLADFTRLYGFLAQWRLSTSPKWQQQQNGPWYHFHVIQQVIFSARKWSLRRLCFHRRLSVHKGRSQSLSGWSHPLGVSVQWFSVQGGVSVQGSLCPGGSLSGGLCPGRSQSRGFSVQGASLSGGGLYARGLCQRRSLSRGSLSGGSLSRRVSVQGGLCPGGIFVQGGLCPGGVSVQGVSVTETLLECILVLIGTHFEVIWRNIWLNLIAWSIPTEMYMKSCSDMLEPELHETIKWR